MTFENRYRGRIPHRTDPAKLFKSPFSFLSRPAQSQERFVTGFLQVSQTD